MKNFENDFFTILFEFFDSTSRDKRKTYLYISMAQGYFKTIKKFQR